MRQAKVSVESFEGKISARGQVVIPHPLREWAQLREGTPLILIPHPDGSILIRRRDSGNTRIGKLRGAWQDDAALIRERLTRVRHPPSTCGHVRATEEGPSGS